MILKATTVQIQNLWFNSFQVIEIQIPGNLSSSSHKAIIIQILGISHAAYANYSYGLSLFALCCLSHLVSNNNFLATNPSPKILIKRFKLPNPSLLAWETDFLHNVIKNEQLFWRKISATRIKGKFHHTRSTAYKTIQLAAMKLDLFHKMGQLS